jgi:hypothetical protein
MENSIYGLEAYRSAPEVLSRIEEMTKDPCLGVQIAAKEWLDN